MTKDQPVLELETDKATIEVPSSVSGTVKEVRIKQGERVKVGELVPTFDNGAAPAKDGTKSATGDQPKPQPVGAADEGGLSPRPRPPAQPAVAPEPKPRRGEVVDIRGRRACRSARPIHQGREIQGCRGRVPGPAAPAAPSVRRLARELGVDIRRVPGSGPAGRISTDDVQSFVREAMAGGAPASAPSALPDFTKWGEVERKPMSNIRRKTAEHLSHAWHAIPHVTQHDMADITALEALRKQYTPQPKAGGKLTMTAIALKIAAAALRKFPQFNSSIDVARNEIVYKQSIHVGVAVDTEHGLLVPVIRDVDRKSVIQLAAELAAASDKARAGKLSPDDMQGAARSRSPTSAASAARRSRRS